MKVINLVLNNFTNDSRVLKTSKTLSLLGVDVKVVALYDVGLDEYESVNGIDVHRIKLSTRHWSKIKFLQFIKVAEFIFRFSKEYRRADILHCNDLAGLFVGFICKLTRPNISLVYDSHEYAINDVPNESRLSIRVKYFIECFLIKFAGEVITVSDSIAREYESLYNIKKPYLVLNCPTYIEQTKHNIFREVLGIGEHQKIFLYQGGLGRGRGIELLLEAFEQFDSNNNVLVCMGYGALEALVLEKATVSANIFFHPVVSPTVLLNYTSSADYGISFIEDSCLSYRYCLPNKLFEYLMAGIPVLTSNLFEMKQLVESEGVGIVTDENTVRGFQKAVMDLLNLDYNTVLKKVKLARKKYCWEEQQKVLKKIYHDF